MVTWEIEVVADACGDEDLAILVVPVQSIGKLVFDGIRVNCVEPNNVTNVEECSHALDHVVWYMACYSG